MGRELRMVPANWEHPKDDRGRYIPLWNRSYTADAQDFLKMANEKGLQEAVDWHGQAPDKNNYMPEWPAEERTHFQMYENTSEGTPISPPMESAEALARWLAETGASAFGGETATYEQWMGTIGRGWSCSAVLSNAGMESGVAGLHRMDSK